MVDRARAPGKRQRPDDEEGETREADGEEGAEDTAAERAARWHALESVLGARVPEATPREHRASRREPRVDASRRAGAPAASLAVHSLAVASQASGGDGGDFAARMRERIQQKQADARARAAGAGK
ncbi:hypothetical protein KFE25_013076 [Diacronema lutheri]|mgnify:CR=1 FL=1|uniref:Uncharacterized protein n=1 Tax=Diacronema lutheri TaxID=2081491 RepID=A0A8J6C716_DIALT|nr:hypothetical protein KFE25_013076 [Diacronema lutheri]